VIRSGISIDRHSGLPIRDDLARALRAIDGVAAETWLSLRNHICRGLRRRRLLEDYQKSRVGRYPRARFQVEPKLRPAQCNPVRHSQRALQFDRYHGRRLAAPPQTRSSFSSTISAVGTTSSTAWRKLSNTDYCAMLLLGSRSSLCKASWVPGMRATSAHFGYSVPISAMRSKILKIRSFPLMCFCLGRPCRSEQSKCVMSYAARGIPAGGWRAVVNRFRAGIRAGENLHPISDHDSRCV